jgi:hypothetical protein
MTRTKVTNSSLSFDGGSLSGNRNRIINGDMRIDQRNAGVSSSINGSNIYTLDRWSADDVTDGAYTIQRSGVVPVGFTSSLAVTVTTADASLAVGQYANVVQHIEGHNISDLEWGTSDAVPITLSFWTRSSLTGTFGGAIRNNGANRSYPFNYPISTANTWEYKTITIPGDTTGTWLRDSNRGMSVFFSLGNGGTFAGTVGSWAAANYVGATGAVNVMGTLNATWYLTGVQLEVGTVATPFERRPYGAELNLCYRYFQQLGNIIYATIGSGVQQNTTLAAINVPLLQSLRTSSPNISISSLIVTDRTSADAVVSSVNETRVSETSLYLSLTHTAFGAAGRGCLLAPNTNGYLRVSAEL